MWHTENTKTKQEEVTAAYDEQVLIQDAWDEPIYPFFRRKPRPTRRAGLFKHVLEFVIDVVMNF